VNIGNAITEAAKAGRIIAGGGHAMAGGLSLEPDQVSDFSAWMNEHMSQFATESAAARELQVDAILGAGAVTPETFDSIATVGPFGQGAPEPLFILADMDITHARVIGQNHLKLSAENADARVDVLSWRSLGTPLGDALQGRGRFHLVGRLKCDEWNGRRRAQLELVDAAPSV
jgi:single-stranded-DNA-specific exonuclease